MNRKLMALAALGSAGLASICCIGPLVLAGLGLAAALSNYRPLFLGLTGVILGLAFYFVYRKRPVACADGSCELRSGGRGVKAGLWLVTAIAAAMALFPYWYSPPAAVNRASSAAGALVLSFTVSGMDCAACTAVIKRSVEKVPGIVSADIDYDGRLLKVLAGQDIDPQTVLQAVAAAGYRAEPVNGENDDEPR